MHSGDVVHGDVPDPSARLHGVVAFDGTTALFAYVQQTAPPWLTAGSLQLSGHLLATVGLALPVLQPEEALVLELRPA